MMVPKSEVQAEAAKLLRAVPEVAIDREWIKEILMAPRDDPDHFVWLDWTGGERTLRKRQTKDPRQPGEPVACSEVAGCCALGFVDLATACANGFSRVADDMAKDMLGDALVELGWAEPVFKATHEALDEDWLPYEEWRDEVLRYRNWDVVGEEGLIPTWNDHYCTGKEQVLELVAKAAEIAERKAAA